MPRLGRQPRLGRARDPEEPAEIRRQLQESRVKWNHENSALIGLPVEVEMIIACSGCTIKDVLRLTQTSQYLRRALHGSGWNVQFPMVDPAATSLHAAGMSALITDPHPSLLLSVLAESANRWVYAAPDMVQRVERIQLVYEAVLQGETALLGFVAKRTTFSLRDFWDLVASRNGMFRDLARKVQRHILDLNRVTRSTGQPRVRHRPESEYIAGLAKYAYFHGLLHDRGRRLVDPPAGPVEKSLMTPVMKFALIQYCVLPSNPLNPVDRDRAAIVQKQIHEFLLPQPVKLCQKDPIWQEHRRLINFLSNNRSTREAIQRRFENAQKVYQRAGGLTTLTNLHKDWSVPTFFADAPSTDLLNLSHNSTRGNAARLSHFLNTNLHRMHVGPWRFMKDLAMNPKWLFPGGLPQRLHDGNQTLLAMAIDKRSRRLVKNAQIAEHEERVARGESEESVSEATEDGESMVTEETESMATDEDEVTEDDESMTTDESETTGDDESLATEYDDAASEDSDATITPGFVAAEYGEAMDVDDLSGTDEEMTDVAESADESEEESVDLNGLFGTAV